MRYRFAAIVGVVMLCGATSVEAAKLQGRVVEPATGAPVGGATVSVVGSDAEAITDAQGKYQIDLEPGTYTLEITAGGDYEQKTVEGVEVTAEETVSREIDLERGGGQDVAEYGDYTVQRGYIEGSPASVVTTQREAPQVSDVIGSEQMDAAGDSEAVGALKRVTGLSVEDGKFISIRGQPERYTETTLNGSPLPSPDPIRDIAPLDLFPTSILSEISVSKSYDASQLGSFGGGLVDLRTLAAPEESYFEISVETGINTESTGEDGLEYEGGDTDFLGFDDGTREISGGLSSGLDGVGSASPQVVDGAQNMPNSWDVDEKTLPPDFGVSLAGGTTTQALGADVGINGTLGWDREYRKTETTERRFNVASDGLQLVEEQREQRTDHDVDLDAFLAVSFDWGRHKLTSNTFLTRRTTERTQRTTGARTISQSVEIQDFLLDFNERELLGEQLVGEHDFDVVDLDWRFLFAQAERDNPDRRFYRRTRALGSNQEFRLSEQEPATRTFISTEDDVTSFSLDLERKLVDGEAFSLDVAAGAAMYSQDRQSATRTVGLEPDSNQVDTTAPVEEILAPENLGNGVEVQDNTNQTDFYEGTADVDAVYLKGDVGWAETLRVVGGVRAENATFETESLTTTADPAVTGFDETDTLPSLSTTWFFAEKMQARLALARTISRPTLNEIAGDPDTGVGVRYRDPDTNEQFQGNPGLGPAEIDSVDLRWEWFPSPSELFAVGVFAKDYTDPLEEELIPSTTQTIRRVINAEEATVEGIEATARLNLPTITSWLGAEWGWANNVYVQGNAAFIDSEVTVGDTTRSLQGQADELFNLLVGYEGGSHNVNFALNYTGERLASVVRRQPNTFEQPRTVVDVNYDYEWSDSLSFNAEVENLLDEEIEETQGNRTFETVNPGVDFSVGLKYRF